MISFFKKILSNSSFIKSLLRSRLTILGHSDNEYQKIVEYLYVYILERKASPEEIQSHLNSCKSPSELLKSFITSNEFLDKQKRKDIVRKKLIRFLYNNLYFREPTNEEIEIHFSNNHNKNEVELLEVFINSEEYRTIKEQSLVDLRTYLGGTTYLLGESHSITPAILLRWYKNFSYGLLEFLNFNPGFMMVEYKTKDTSKALLKESLEHEPLVTIITSLYKGEKYIKAFLENITSQTIFNQCQLFIIDANSPENEYEVIKDYLNLYENNIVYHKVNEVIGIYEAWNIAIKSSRSEFITNANLDDLQRSDALEIKVKALKNNPEIDVVYSDVYYSFIENAPFEVIEKCGLKTNLPTANKFNLLKFNSPHNSPMWRRSLHDKIGLFDSTYKSAGDMEFWLRAAFSNCQFMKVDEPVVAYYHNPNGLSTRPDSLGCIEGGKVIEIYKDLLTDKFP